MIVSEVTSVVVETESHCSVVQIQRNLSLHELVHKDHVEKSAPIVLSTNMETMHYRTLIHDLLFSLSLQWSLE